MSASFQRPLAFCAVVAKDRGRHRIATDCIDACTGNDLASGRPHRQRLAAERCFSSTRRFRCGRAGRLFFSGCIHHAWIWRYYAGGELTHPLWYDRNKRTSDVRFQHRISVRGFRQDARRRRWLMEEMSAKVMLQPQSGALLTGTGLFSLSSCIILPSAIRASLQPRRCPILWL